LVVAGNPLGDSGAVEIARALAKHPSVLEFNVCDTGIGAVGAKLVAGALRSSNMEIVSTNSVVQDMGMKVRAIEKEMVVRSKVLDLSGRDIGDVGFAQLLGSLRRMKNVERINLSKCRLGPDGARTLARILPQFGQLKSVAVAYNALGDTGVLAIAEAVAKSNVVEFNVRGTDMSGEGAREVAASLRNSKVDMLHVSNNHVTSGTGIVKSIEREIDFVIQSGARVLNFSGREIGDMGLWLVSSSMKRMTGVRKINLSKCGLGPDGGKTLGAILTHLPRIESVIAAFNSFGDAGVAAIARGVEGSDIIELNLRGTDMTSSGARRISASLASTEVETLNLADNRIDETAMAGIADLVRVGTVETLNLSRNKIGDAAALAVLTSGSLEKLDLEG
jgi:Ran GTPase-activating protein (RanGAP) involved in mRNA processing and transport